MSYEQKKGGPPTHRIILAIKPKEEGGKYSFLDVLNGWWNEEKGRIDLKPAKEWTSSKTGEVHQGVKGLKAQLTDGTIVDLLDGSLSLREIKKLF